MFIVQQSHQSHLYANRHRCDVLLTAGSLKALINGYNIQIFNVILMRFILFPFGPLGTACVTKLSEFKGPIY